MTRLVPLAAALSLWSVFWLSGSALQDVPRVSEEALLRVRMPVPLQLAYAGGDPYLAANLNVFRSMMVDARVTEWETYRVQAALQQDAARLNPYHEDNYYIAAALLPWNGFVEEAQEVLHRAAEARSWDWMPPFYYAFGKWYFEHEPAQAGEWAEVAAQRSSETNARALRAMAAKWYEKSDDPALAKRLIVAMLEQTRDASLRAQLQVRIERLDGLLALRTAHAAFVARRGSGPRSLDELVGYGGLFVLPSDPLQLGYALDNAGLPVLAAPRR
jgi:tetratricopeptide (TPR) repeat protein